MEIKTSSHKSQIFGNRSYAQKSSATSKKKTGYYLDQRENRKRIMPYLAGKEVLNCFSYTGGFSAYAAAANAGRVMNIVRPAPISVRGQGHYTDHLAHQIVELG